MLWKYRAVGTVEHKINAWVRINISFLSGPQEPLATVKRRKLACFWYVTRHDSLSKTISQGTLEGGRRRGRRRKAGWTSKSGHPRPCQDCYCNGPLQKRPEEKLYRIVPHVPPTARSVKGLNWTGNHGNPDTFSSDWLSSWYFTFSHCIFENEYENEAKWTGRQKLEIQISWQWAKHTKLRSDLLRD